MTVRAGVPAIGAPSLPDKASDDDDRVGQSNERFTDPGTAFSAHFQFLKSPVVPRVRALDNPPGPGLCVASPFCLPLEHSHPANSSLERQPKERGASVTPIHDTVVRNTPLQGPSFFMGRSSSWNSSQATDHANWRRVSRSTITRNAWPLSLPVLS